jgi:hypothetical protein
VKSEFMAHGMTETFTNSGCDFTIKTADNLQAQSSQEIVNDATFKFTLRDIDPGSVIVTGRSHFGDFSCEADADGTKSIMAENCDHAEMGFKTRNEAGLITVEWHVVYVKLSGAQHERRNTTKDKSSYFEFDDVEYARRFSKAFKHAVELCGGKASPF